MRVKLTRIMAGPDGAFSAGSVIDVDKAQASALIDGGYAEKSTAAPVVAPEPAPAAETATAPRAPERAVRPRAKKR